MAGGVEEAAKLKGSLEKALLEESDDRVCDILKILNKFPMTEDILRATKLGVVVNKFAKASGDKFASSTYALAKEVVSAWKAAVKSPNTTTAAPSSTTPSKAAGVAVTVKKPAPAAAARPSRPPAPVIELTAAQTELLKPYLDGRKQTVKLLQENLYRHMGDSETDENGETSGSDAAVTAGILDNLFHRAIAIETEINLIAPLATNSKGYNNKSSTLMTNIKRNEALAHDIISGELSAKALCQLSIEQLATRAEQEQQQQILNRKFDAGRTDYYDVIMRDKVMEANGLDPNAPGDFTCRKCKGTKTSHYAMQTRSSDEPMTVFVKCLTCGARWRC